MKIFLTRYKECSKYMFKINTTTIILHDLLIFNNQNN